MNIRAPLIANLEPPKAIHLAMRPVYDPPVPAQVLRGVDAPPRNPRCNPLATQGAALRPRIVGLIGMQLGRPLAGPPTRPLDRFQRIQSRFHHRAVRDMSGREGEGQWNPLAVDHKMALRTRFAAIRWIRPGVLVPRGQAPWRSQLRPASSRHGPPRPGSLVDDGGRAARLPRPATPGVTANRSCRSHSPALGAIIPRGCRS